MQRNYRSAWDALEDVRHSRDLWRALAIGAILAAAVGWLLALLPYV